MSSPFYAHACPDGAVVKYPLDLNTEDFKVEVIGRGQYGGKVELTVNDFLSAAARMLGPRSPDQFMRLQDAHQEGDWRTAFNIPAPPTQDAETSSDDSDIPL